VTQCVPEPLCDRLPVIGRGMADGRPDSLRAVSHEVMRPPGSWRQSPRSEMRGGHADSANTSRQQIVAGMRERIIGRFTSGEIYNQFPTMLEAPPLAAGHDARSASASSARSGRPGRATRAHRSN